jgi:hypothetical protein
VHTPLENMYTAISDAYKARKCIYTATGSVYAAA